MMAKVIPVTCDPEGRLRRVPLAQLKRFQGTLKTLYQGQYNKLKASMESKGFFAPIFLWAGHDYILDGHQRLNVLEREQWDVEGGIPVVDIEAADEKDAAEKLLILSSTYGKIDPQGVYEFTEMHEIPLTEFALADLPDFNYQSYMAGFYDIRSDANDEKIDVTKEWQGMPEFEQEEFPTFKTLLVHFETLDDYNSFAQLLNKKLTVLTKSIWFPDRPEELKNQLGRGLVFRQPKGGNES